MRQARRAFESLRKTWRYVIEWWRAGSCYSSNSMNCVIYLMRDVVLLSMRFEPNKYAAASVRD